MNTSSTSNRNQEHRYSTSPSLPGTSLSSTSIIQRTFDRLRSDKMELLILDGGTGEELFRRGVPDDRKIWSATAVVHDRYHSTLKEVHCSFLSSGSDVITTNSYGITPGVGFSLENGEISRYIGVAGKLAREAVMELGGSKMTLKTSASEGAPLSSSSSSSSPSSLGYRHYDLVSKGVAIVCGSLGPQVESYRPDLLMKHETGVMAYQVAIKALAPYVDCYLAETMSSFEEASQAVEAVGREFGLEENEKRNNNNNDNLTKKPMMVSFTLNSDGHIRSGESVVEGIRNIVNFAKRHHVQLLGVMFNCAEPEAITLALKSIQSNDNFKQFLNENRIILGAYANRLTPVASDWSLEESDAAQSMRDDLPPHVYFDKFVSVWIRDFGVQMVGGCCGITPEHISYIRSHLPELNKK